MRPVFAPSKPESFWSALTMGDMLDQAVVRFPDKVAITAFRADRDELVRITFSELGPRVDRVAAALHGRGVRRADVVAIQLPN